MMNQKFSQLNRDYAKSAVGRDNVSIKQPIFSVFIAVFIGVLVIVMLMVGFYLLKKPLVKQVSQLSKTPKIETKPKVVSKKRPKAKVNSNINQEYGFYTMLPKMEVKSAQHEEALSNE